MTVSVSAVPILERVQELECGMWALRLPQNPVSLICYSGMGKVLSSNEFLFLVFSGTEVMVIFNENVEITFPKSKDTFVERWFSATSSTYY